MSLLIDTSFLLAATHSKDVNHALAKAAQQTMKGQERVVPAPVVYELFYMLKERVNYAQAVATFEVLQSPAFKIEKLLPEDMRRMLEIMRQYASADFDYADIALVALSERLNITQVYTFDRRDFSIFRPKHCPYLELLPTS